MDRRAAWAWGVLLSATAACSSPSVAGPGPGSAASSATAPARASAPVAAAPAPSASGAAPSASASAANDLPRTGREISLDDALGRSSAVVVGKFTKLGKADVGAPGQSYFDGAEIEISNALSGSMKGAVPVVYTVQRLPERSAEALPSVGESLIFVIATDGGQTRAIKMLTATSENVADVKAALARRH
jgi:hypothetical protein